MAVYRVIKPSFFRSADSLDASLHQVGEIVNFAGDEPGPGLQPLDDAAKRAVARQIAGKWQRGNLLQPHLRVLEAARQIGCEGTETTTVAQHAQAVEQFLTEWS
jgi:hypothetical protein